MLIPRPLLAAALLGLACLAASGQAQEVLTSASDRAALHCRQPSADTLDCDLRGPALDPAASISATLGDVRLPVGDTRAFGAAGERIAVLMLVDTSDPARAAVVSRIGEQIGRMIAQAGAGIVVGLARFDTDYQLLVPIGGPPDELGEAAATLRAAGKTTELYRAVREGARELGKADARRRFLFLFSDGLAEDYAYGHADAVEAARAAGAGIMAFGYPRSVPLSVALQSLRKLAEDTGGRYHQADAGGAVPASLLAAPFAGLDEGRFFSIDLAPAAEAGLGGSQRIAISAGEAIQLDLPVRLPPVAAPVAVAPLPPAPAAVAAPSAPVRPPEATTAPPAAARPGAVGPADSALTPWIWFGTPAAMLLAVVIALIVYGRIWRRGTERAPVKAVSAAEYAYLVRRDIDGERYVIAGSPYRIGRSKNNELTIDDNSVSRLHAEIHRRHDGTFTIMDLESLNGIFVNDKKVKTVELNEGDELDIGDVPLRFTLYDDDKAALEPTVMIGTRAPG